MEKPAPLITIDERGVILHLTDSKGDGVAVPLNLDTANELAAQLAIALERLRAPETRSGFLWSLARAVAREVLTPEGSKRGTPGA